MDDYTFEIIENAKVSADAYRMTLETEIKLPKITAGQFLQFRIPERPDFSLRRPFCVCQYDERTVTLYYAVAGYGTAVMAGLKPGVSVQCALPLGNGFYLDGRHKSVALIGGGLGAAPLLPVPRSFPGKEYRAYLGFNSASHVILQREFEAAVKECKIATDDGSFGRRGYPTDILKEDIAGGYKPDVLLVCGPTPMLRAVRDIAESRGIDAYMTGENRMGCGVGACLVCTCKVMAGGGAYHNLRSCADGPVFDLKKVEL